jgi:hypothetical protein
MKFSEIDWRVLRGSVILLVIALAIVGTALAMSFQFKSRQETSLARERTMMIASRSRYQDLDEEEDIIATYLPRDSDLEDKGIIGREQRLDWIDVLRQSAREVRVPRLQYTIEAQRRFDTGLDLQVGDYRVFASSMQLQLGLLHEGDLIRLLSKLRDGVNGLFGVSGCSMSRPRGPLRLEPDAANVDARCVINFITIRGPDENPTS